MASNKKKEILEKYNCSAYAYEKRYKKIQFNKLTQLLSDFKLEEKKIFDAGCGTGLFVDFLMEHPDIFDLNYFLLVGVDISIKMLENFRQKLRQAPELHNTISLIQADLENLPLRSDQFNVLVSLTSYQNLPNIKKGVQESIRISENRTEAFLSVLKKGIEKSEFLSLIKAQINPMNIIDDPSIEDLLIKGTLTKSTRPRRANRGKKN